MCSAYYAGAFGSHQQKEISGFLRKMWKVDPFQAKWAILAKAYSIIRDHKGKAFAPLDLFLSLTCPHIGIITANEYLPRLGWSLVVEDGCKVLCRTSAPSPASFDDSLKTTNLSVQDIINYCHENKFVETNNIDVSNSAPSLALATRPSTTSFMSAQTPYGTINSFDSAPSSSMTSTPFLTPVLVLRINHFRSWPAQATQARSTQVTTTTCTLSAFDFLNRTVMSS